MKFSEWFNNWQWLKNSSAQEYSFNRIISLYLVLFQPVWPILLKTINIPEGVYGFSTLSIPIIGALAFMAIELIKENKWVQSQISKYLDK